MAITASSGTVKARTLSARGGRTVATPLRLVQSCKNLRSEPFAYIIRCARPGEHHIPAPAATVSPLLIGPALAM